MKFKKKNGWIKGLVIAVLIIGGLGAIGYMNKEAIVDRFPWLNGTPSSSEVSELPSEETSEDLSEEVPSSEEPELLNVIRIKTKYDAQGSLHYSDVIFAEDCLNLYQIYMNFVDHEIEATFYTIDDFLILEIPFNSNVNFWLSPNVMTNPIYSQNYAFEEPGLYDFSGITEITNEMILEPVYTPIYVE